MDRILLHRQGHRKAELAKKWIQYITSAEGQVKSANMAAYPAHDPEQEGLGAARQGDAGGGQRQRMLLDKPNDMVELIRSGRIQYRQLPVQQSLEDWNDFWTGLQGRLTALRASRMRRRARSRRADARPAGCRRWPPARRAAADARGPAGATRHMRKIRLGLRPDLLAADAALAGPVLLPCAASLPDRAQLLDGAQLPHGAGLQPRQLVARCSAARCSGRPMLRTLGSRLGAAIVIASASPFPALVRHRLQARPEPHGAGRSS